MMKIENVVNDIVLVILNESGPLKDVGIARDKFYTRVVGYDEFGIWLQHPNFEVVLSEDEKGKPLPPDQVKRERLDASVHIPWRNIASLIHFPEREGFDFPSPFERRMGFRTEGTASEGENKD